MKNDARILMVSRAKSGKLKSDLSKIFLFIFDKQLKLRTVKFHSVNNSVFKCMFQIKLLSSIFQIQKFNLENITLLEILTHIYRR